MPLEQAQQMKCKAYSEYLNDITCKKRYTAAYAQHQEAIKLAGTLRAEALKCEDKDKLIGILAEIVGAMTIDPGFAKRINEKWSEKK